MIGKNVVPGQPLQSPPAPHALCQAIATDGDVCDGQRLPHRRRGETPRDHKDTQYVETTKLRWILHPECGSGVWLPSRRALAAVAETAGDATARRWIAALRQGRATCSFLVRTTRTRVPEPGGWWWPPWTDTFIMRPAEYVWPVCVVCLKFLRPGTASEARRFDRLGHAPVREPSALRQGRASRPGIASEARRSAR